jgi:hypothetical protein
MSTDVAPFAYQKTCILIPLSPQAQEYVQGIAAVDDEPENPSPNLVGIRRFCLLHQESRNHEPDRVPEKESQRP